jgi:hypothetical protein
VKLTPAQRKEIEDRLRAGEKQGALSSEYGVSQTWICRIAVRIGCGYNTKFAKKIRYAEMIDEIDASIRRGERPIYIARRLDVPVYYIRRYVVSIGQHYKQHHTKKARAYQSQVRA